jgi:hypothetical protein
LAITYAKRRRMSRRLACVGERSDGAEADVPGLASRSPEGYLPYGERKPYVVADSLTALNGPVQGMVTLPHHLDWSGRPDYDLSRPPRMAAMYKVVLTEAGTVDDLRNWLSGDVLLRLWPTLWLTPQLRRRWEERFPELAVAHERRVAGRRPFTRHVTGPVSRQLGRSPIS